MYKTHPTLTLLLTCSVMTAAGCSLEVTLDPEDMRKPAEMAGQNNTSTKKTVTLALGTCSIQGGTLETANYSIKQSSGLLLQILYPDVCEPTMSIFQSSFKEYSQNSAGTQVECPIVSSDSPDSMKPVTLPSPAYVRVQEKYWLPSVQNFVTNAPSWGSFISQGRISLRTEKNESLQLSGVRASGLLIANPRVTKPLTLEEAGSVSKLTAPESVGLSRIVFHVPSSCQIKGTDHMDLMDNRPEWQITSIEISDSPDFQ